MTFKPFDSFGNFQLYIRLHTPPDLYEGYALDSHYKEIARTKPVASKEAAKEAIKIHMKQMIKVS